MKKKYSSRWLASKQPRKQRKYRYNAPLHRRQKMLSAHLAKDLRQQYKRRSLPLRKGDEVKVLRGEFKGLYGKVEKIDLQKLKVKVENIKRRKASGEEVAVSIDPSNLLVMKLDLNDKKRFAALKKGA
ncbi:MAG: 50S ribosomal protein L24 [Candidatus Aenigmarchaeota archaeon]|nr:50S ribosomal protein L24 [Candidatus Aenigmarchaeota archaeon]